MSYEINVTPEFELWWADLTEGQQEDVAARVELLSLDGPSLGRPTVDRVIGSAYNHMKELRCRSEGALRVLFAFDPRREAILLLGGDKTGRWSEWYAEAIPRADELYGEYLAELKEKGLIE